MAEPDATPDQLPRRRQRGRKPVAPELARRHPVTCRLTDAELAHVDEARGEVTRGEFIRLAALKAPPRVVPAVNREAWLELARLSGNFNQLTRAINAGRVPAPKVSLIELREAVEAVRLSLLGGTPADPDEPEEGIGDES